MMAGALSVLFFDSVLEFLESVPCLLWNNQGRGTSCNAAKISCNGRCKENRCEKSQVLHSCSVDVCDGVVKEGALLDTGEVETREFYFSTYFPWVESNSMPPSPDQKWRPMSHGPLILSAFDRFVLFLIFSQCSLVWESQRGSPALYSLHPFFPT